VSPEKSIDLASEVPRGWSATKQAQAGIDAQWIERFNDGRLNALAKEGLKNNGSIKAGTERLRQAQQRSKITASAGRPQLGAGLNSSRQKDVFLGLGDVGNDMSAYSSYGVSVEASWEIDLWGRLKAARQADIATFESQRWMQRGAEASLQAQIAKAYFALVESNQQIMLAENTVDILAKTRDAIAERFNSALSDEGGTASQYRVAESDIESARADLARWKGQRDGSARQLELLIGRYPSASISAAQVLPKLPSTPPVGLPSELLLRRPDILAAERNYAASLEQLEEARLAIFPTFALTASTGTRSLELGNILNSDFGVWSLGGALSQSILTGGRLKAEKEIRDSEAKARLIELHDTVLTAFSEVETRLSAETFLRERIDATGKAFSLSKEAVETARVDYQSGVSDIQTLLNAESRYIQTSSALVSLQRLALENRIDLHLALGGDFTPRQK